MKARVKWKVYKVLAEIGAQDKPVLCVYNKIDKLGPESSGLLEQLQHRQDTICISAKQQIGLEELLTAITNHLKLKSIELKLLIPYSDSAAAARMHVIGTVLSEEYSDQGTVMLVRVDTADDNRITVTLCWQGPNDPAVRNYQIQAFVH